MLMSGLLDGELLEFSTEDGHGSETAGRWTIHIGRHDSNDFILQNDTFVSRNHARLHWHQERWWLEDRDSTNGTFTENSTAFFEDTRVKGIVPIDTDRLFRIGRTWMRIHPVDQS